MKKTIAEIEEIGEEKLMEEGDSLLPTVEPQEEESPFFTLGMWKGMRQWKCKLCPWDTLEGELALMEHYAAAHAPEEPARPSVNLLVADKWGNEIEDY